IVEAGDALIINTNDSPLLGERGFLRRLIRRHGNTKTYLLALCAIDADMINIVDGNDAPARPEPHEVKPGQILNIARMAAGLGVRHFCCSSSQHLYVRADSV